MAIRVPARCRDCQAPVVFYRSPFTTSVRTFDPKPIDGHHPHAIAAFPVMGRSAYKFADLAEVIQVQRACSLAEAEAEVRDMPWHVLHTHEPTNSTDEKETTHP